LRKRLLYIAFAGLLILFHINASAQKQKPKNDSWYDDKPLHFGFSLGMNMMDFNITPSQEDLEIDGYYPEVSTLYPGINIQVVTNLRPGKYFDLRFLPGISFGQRTVRYYDFDTGAPIEEVKNGVRVESAFLEFPLLLKYKGDRLNNVRPYVIGGLNYRYDLAGQKVYDEDKREYLRLKKSDLYYEAGAGLDFYLPYFKFSVELKMSNGLRDIIDHVADPRNPAYANSIEKMKSQIWILSFHFE